MGGVRKRFSGRKRWAVQLAKGLQRAGEAAMDHDALNLAQATAFSAISALFPALIVVAAVVGQMPNAAPFRSQMATFFNRVLPSNVTPLLGSYFSQTGHHGHTVRAVLTSAVVSLIGSVGVMATLMEGFRRAHRLPLLRSTFWPVRVRALALVPLSLLPMTAASLLVVFGHTLTVRLGMQLAPGLRPAFYVLALLLRWSVALAGSVGIVAVIYHLGTDLTRSMFATLDSSPEGKEASGREPFSPVQALRDEWKWSASLPGAALATALWFLSTLLFGVYVTRFANYSQVYGPLGAGIALLFWLYLITLSVLMGAEFNAQRTVQQRDPRLAEFLHKLPGRRRRTGRGARQVE